MPTNHSGFVRRNAMRFAGSLWTLGNAVIIAKGGLAGDPVIAGTGILNVACSGSSMALGETAKPFYGPGSLASGAVFTGESIRNGRLGDAMFGIGVELGLTTMFYGPQIYRAAKSVTPISRLLKKLPTVGAGKVAETILLGAYASEIAEGLSRVITGLVNKDANSLQQGAASLGLIASYVAGNRMASIAADTPNILPPRPAAAIAVPNP